MVVWGPLRTFLLIWSAHDPRQIPAIGLYNVHWPLAVRSGHAYWSSTLDRFI